MEFYDILWDLIINNIDLMGFYGDMMGCITELFGFDQELDIQSK
jgi:hypothetical protein